MRDNMNNNANKLKGLMYPIRFIIGFYSIIIGIFNIIFFSYISRCDVLWTPTLEILLILTIIISWLIIGGFLSIIREYSKIRTILLIITQITFEILTLDLFGWIFLIGSIILVILVIGVAGDK